MFVILVERGPTRAVSEAESNHTDGIEAYVSSGFEPEALVASCPVYEA